MADASCSGFDKLWRFTREVVEDANEVAENEKRFQTVRGFHENLRNIQEVHKKEDGEEKTTVYNRKKKAVENTCKSGAYCDLMPVIATKAIITDTVREFKEKAMAELPGHMKANVKEAAHYLMKADECFIKIDETLERMEDLVRC